MKNTRTSLQRFARHRELELGPVILFIKQSTEHALKVRDLEELRWIDPPSGFPSGIFNVVGFKGKMAMSTKALPNKEQSLVWQLVAIWHADGIWLQNSLGTWSNPS